MSLKLLTMAFVLLSTTSGWACNGLQNSSELSASTSVKTQKSPQKSGSGVQSEKGG